MKKIYNQSINILRKIIETEKTKDIDYSHNKFFKSSELTEKNSNQITADF